ncbi:MAG: hypothetical protein PX637_01635 [Microcystis sp. M53601_WE4]|nr:hypothetical protein [Microcystis sp. M53601_WE4]
MTPSKSLKPYTPHPTPHTLSPPTNFLPQTQVMNCCQWAKSRF